MKWFKWLLVFAITLIAIVAGSLYLSLSVSVPQYNGEIPADVTATVRLQRDTLGYLSVHAANRQDAAYGLGFAHAQDRFFQMDLLRRNAAGELSALFGEKAITADKTLRRHRFRQRAMQALENLPPQQQQLLTAYTNGVNAGLASLTLPPFEYWLLRQQPQPWQPADSFLVLYSMYLDLQGKQGRDEYAMTVLKQSIPAEWYAFLQQHSPDYQAAIDDTFINMIPMPDSPYPQALQQSLAACVDCTVKDATDLGSNNFAVAGVLTPHGSAILADDMHLGQRVPGIWFKAQLNWRDGAELRQLTGVTLPGTPALIAGSNGKIAWGFTNSTADWQDLIALTVSEDGKRYLTATGWQPFTYYYDTIKVAGGDDVAIQLTETQWGPLINFADSPPYALRWIGYDEQAVNFNLTELENVSTAAEAMTIAPRTGIPAQNLLVADHAGSIGWSIMGIIPKRADYDWDTAQDWSKGEPLWQGYIAPSEQPVLLNPASNRLWSANARTVGAERYALLGNGGYDLGARGAQIRQNLFSRNSLDEIAMHQIQLDDTAMMLHRWQQLLLNTLTAERVTQYQLQQYRDYIERSSAAASTDAIGYTLVRQFREQLLQLQFAPLSALLEQHGARSRDLKFSLETALWQMLQQKRLDSLVAPYSSWDELLVDAILQSKQQLEQQNGSLENSRWGLLNTAKIDHPLASAIPLIGDWLNMPHTELNGDSHMPRVQRSGFGQSERMVVAPGHEESGILTIPAGQSGHPLSPFYRADHTYWLNGVALPFLPGEKKYQLSLSPKG